MILVNNLHLNFNGQLIFNNFSLNVEKGEKVAVKGESGSGKTSLLNVLMGFIMPDSGEIEIMKMVLNKENLSNIRSEIAWVPQEMNVAPGINADELALLPFSFKRNREIRPSHESLLEEFRRLGLNESILKKSLNEISGGEKQRILLASGILLKRKLVFLDEPTSALDKESKRKVIERFQKNNEFTVLSVSHDDEWLASAGRVIEISKNEGGG